MRRVRHPFERIAAIAADAVSGATRLTVRAAGALGGLESTRDRMRAARVLLRAKGAVAPLWSLCALAIEGAPAAELRAYADALMAAQSAAARNARWITGGRRRRIRVVTWSNASVLVDALAAMPVADVCCLRSGGHGTRLATRLRRDDLPARVADDVRMLDELRQADVALVGADAIGALVVNATGTELLTIAARELHVPVYAIAAEAKLLPRDLAERVATAPFEAFGAERLDAVITEHGPRSRRWLAERGERITLPSALRRLVS